jgi:predicted small metal-binding protein
MGYEFECTNVVPGCEGIVEGDSPDEVLEKAAAHAASVHGMTELPDEVVEKVKSSIVETD